MVNLFGKSTVLSLINPPEKSPETSGVNDFTITVFSKRFVGIKSNAKDFLSGSVPGRFELLSKALLYLSEVPLT